MKAVTVSEMRSIENAAIENGWPEERLMESAGERLAHAFSRFFPTPGTVVAYLGKGHNAGDALVALRFLRDNFHWKIAIRPAFPPEKWAPLTRVKSFELGAVEHFQSTPPWEILERPLILLDALLGIGAKGGLRDPLTALAEEMNGLREHAGAKTSALDVPSGVDPDSGEIHAHPVIADITFMIGAPKRGLLPEQAANATGALSLVPVDPLSPSAEGDFQLIDPRSVASCKIPRPFSFHKGSAGRVGILAGSKSYSGAAVLAATGALRGGAGLVTLHVPADAAGSVTAKVPPEIIVRACDDPRELLQPHYDSLVIGCGLHSDDGHFRNGVKDLIAGSMVPTVIDAEALNLLAEESGLSLLTHHHLLTPHPGEFKRLSPDLAGTPREEAARLFTDRSPATLLLKGCRTIVTRAGEPLWFNPTGAPGMATGGQGDLLAGVLGALLAIGNEPIAAAAAGAWLCGRAAERALLDPTISVQSLLPSDVLHHLGGAFNDWSERGR